MQSKIPQQLTYPIGSFLSAVLLLTCLLTTSQLQALPHVGFQTSKQIDQSLSAVLDALVAGKGEQALKLSSQLVKKFPRYQLGQLLHAEILSVFSHGTALLSSTGSLSAKNLQLLLEAKTRYQLRTAEQHNVLLPSSLLKVNRHIKHLIVVDLSISQLYLYANDLFEGLVLRDVQYVSSGAAGAGKNFEGDLRTPIGLYRITRFRPDETLPKLYGSGALTLNYPNAIDRLAGRKGSGIWLHGLPAGSLARAPHSSEGCVVLPNDSLRALHRELDPETTLVVFSGELQWLTREQAKTKTANYWPLFEHYRDTLPKRSSTVLPVNSGKAQTRALLNPLQELTLDDLSIIEYPPQNPSPNTGINKEVKLKSLESVPSIKLDIQEPDGTLIMMRFTASTQTRDSAAVLSEQHTTLYWQLKTAGIWHLVHHEVESKAF